MGAAESVDESPLWANRIVTAVLNLASILIVVYVLEADLFQTSRALWGILCTIDLAIVGVIIAEHARTHAKAEEKRRWWIHHGWEFAGALPLFLSAIIPGIALLRFIRLARVIQVISELMGLGSPEQAPAKRHFQHLMVVVGSLIVTSGFLVYLFERDQYTACLANPSCNADGIIHTLPDAMWWAIVSTTTTGYGDFAPVTLLGRAIAVLLLVVGVGMVGTFCATISQLILRSMLKNDPRWGAPSTDSLSSELSDLATLHDRGVLDDDEFADAKALCLTSLANAVQRDGEPLNVPLSIGPQMRQVTGEAAKTRREGAREAFLKVSDSSQVEST
jgi:hypothetical protein